MFPRRGRPVHPALAAPRVRTIRELSQRNTPDAIGKPSASPANANAAKQSANTNKRTTAPCPTCAPARPSPADPRHAPQRRPGTVERESGAAGAPSAYGRLARNGAARGHAARMERGYRRVRGARTGFGDANVPLAAKAPRPPENRLLGQGSPPFRRPRPYGAGLRAERNTKPDRARRIGFGR